ncbi:MAG: hypothetical protein O7G86_00080, partial [Gammaproteobacteria bacterium]|nr:hypothetical protein [Gammaproteobacteria bacterium]
MISLFRILLLSGLFCFGPVSFAADSLDTIIIDKGVDDPVRIAVVPFRQRVSMTADGKPLYAFDGLQNMSDIIGFDLARSGQFSP